MVTLEELYIELCNDLSELVIDQHDIRVSQLVELTLQKLPKLKTILVKPMPHYLMRIRELTIHKCHMLNHISWVANLESLEKLTITCCRRIMQIMIETPSGTKGDPGPSNRSEIENADNNTVFPKLRSIVLSELQQLVIICNARDFPCLESVRIQDCPKLKKLPIARDCKITKLRQICGSLEWWQDLRWDDKDLGESFEDFFIPYGSNGGN